jgi:hypothetical protein
MLNLRAKDKEKKANEITRIQKGILDKCLMLFINLLL